MTREEKQVATKLQQLEKQVRRNDRLMRKAFMRYQELISAKASLNAGIQALRAFQEARRRNSLKLLNSRLVSQNVRSLNARRSQKS